MSSYPSSSSVDEAYRESVYRLVYVLPQFDVLRSRLLDTNSASDLVSQLRDLNQAQRHQIVSRLLRANADQSVRSLVSSAALKTVLSDGVRSGFFLPHRPSGLGEDSQLSTLRSQAAPLMQISGSRTDALNDRLSSSNDALWFALEAQQLQASDDDFRAAQYEKLIKPKLKTMLDANVPASDARDELERWMYGDGSSKPAVRGGAFAARASKQVLCAEMARAVGMLQVYVVDDEVVKDSTTARFSLRKPVSSNAQRFLNAFGKDPDTGEDLKEGDEDIVYSNWLASMKRHDRLLRYLTNLMETALQKNPDLKATESDARLARVASFVYSYSKVPKLGMKTSSGEREEISPGAFRSSAPEYRGKLWDAISSFPSDLVKASSKALVKASSKVYDILSGNDVDTTARRDNYRFADWISEMVTHLREMSNMAFVLYLPDASSSSGSDPPPRHMRPGWHSYSKLENRPSSGDDDKQAVTRWITALLNSDLRSSPYSSVDTKQVEKCQTVVRRAAEMLGVSGEDASEMQDAIVDLACKQSGSCLDKQYVQVSSTPGESEDHSNSLARRLLKFGDLQCADEERWAGLVGGEKKTLPQALCEARVDRACEDSGAECGQTLYGSRDDFKKEVCGTSSLRKRLSACEVAEDVTSVSAKKKDAECLRRIASDAKKEEATCYGDLQRKYKYGREGWALVQVLEGNQSSAVASLSDVCVRQYGDLKDVQDVLRGMSGDRIRDKLLSIEAMPSDDRLKELVRRVCKDIVCEPKPDLPLVLGLHDSAVVNMELFCDGVRSGTYKDEDEKPVHLLVRTPGATISNAPPLYLVGGVVVSSQEYDNFKERYMHSRATSLTPQKTKDRLSAIFSLIDLQCAGMEEVSSSQIMTGPFGISVFVHRMLYPRFKEAVQRSESQPPYYVQVVGQEYVDWMLMVLDHHTKRRTNGALESSAHLEAAIQGACKALSATSSKFAVLDSDGGVKVNPDLNKDGCPRTTFLSDARVMEHLYNRLAYTVLSSGATRGGVETRLSADVELVARLCEQEVIRDAAKPDDSKYKSMVSQVKWLGQIVPGSEFATKRAFTYDRLSELASDSRTTGWWRKLLSLSLLTPSVNGITDRALRNLVDDPVPSSMKCDALYAALLCISRSSPSIQNAAVHVMDAIAERVTERRGSKSFSANDAFTNIESQEGAEGSHADDYILAYDTFIQEKTQNVGDRSESCKGPFEAYTTLVANRIMEDDRLEPSALATTKQLVDELYNKALQAKKEEWKRARGSRTRNLLAGAKQAVENDPAMYITSSAAVAAGLLASSPFTVPAAMSATAGVPLVRAAARFLFGVNSDIEEQGFPQTQKQNALSEKLNEFPDIRREVMKRERVLVMLMGRFKLLGDETGIQDTHVPIVSELLHAARLSLSFENERDGTGLKVNLKQILTMQNLLPSELFVMNDGGVNLTEEQANFIFEYTIALYGVVPAYIATRDKINTDEGFVEALFRATHPVPRNKDFDIRVMVNPYEDFLYAPLFQDVALKGTNLKNLRRFHLCSVAEQTVGKRTMHYVPVTTADLEYANDQCAKLRTLLNDPTPHVLMVLEKAGA